MTLLVEAFVVYFAGIFLVPNLKDGTTRRVLERLYAPLVYLGLWHRWSMYSPEVPDGTRIGLVAVVHEDGHAEVVPLPGFDDDQGFGKAYSLRFISFQYALSDPSTEYLRSALCDYALDLWRQRRSEEDAHPEPVAVELREYWYPSPPPGRRETRAEPTIRTLWRRALQEGP